MGGGDISHDGQRIALFQSSGESVELIAVARNGSRRERVTPLSPAYVYTSPRWSPDDRSIAIQRLDVSNQFNVSLEIIQVSSGERREVTRSEWLRGFSWLPDGSGLVYSSSRGSTSPLPPVFNVRAVDETAGAIARSHSAICPRGTGRAPVGQVARRRIRGQSDVAVSIGGSAAENTRDGADHATRQGRPQTRRSVPMAPGPCLSDNGRPWQLWTPGRMDRACADHFERDTGVVLGVRCGRPPATGSCSSSRRVALFVVGDLSDGSGLHQLTARGWSACWSGDGRWVSH